MLRSSSSKAQTEPIAAIVAVSVFVLGLGVYAVFLQGLLPGTSESATADRAIDRIWTDVETDGVFHAHDDGDAELSNRITATSLPAGETVYVTVTAIDGDEERVVARAAFPPGYPHETGASDVSALERHLEQDGPPEEASIATRTIPITVVSAAEVRSGTLEVAVW